MAGRLASSTLFKFVEALPVMATVTLGGVQVALSDALPLQPALQSTAPLHDGGVSATSHFGAWKSTEQLPLQVPSHFAVALAVDSQLPLQLPVQVPSQATALVPVPVWPAQVPSHVPLHVVPQDALPLAVTEQVPVQVALQPPLK